MATAEKVHSFVGKFLALWANGDEVTLMLNAKNGRAKATIELDLGQHNTDDNHKSTLHEQPKVLTGTSRQRRIERRRQERKIFAEKALLDVPDVNLVSADEEATDNNAEKALTDSDIEDKQLAIADAKIAEDSTDNSIELESELSDHGSNGTDSILAAVDEETHVIKTEEVGSTMSLDKLENRVSISEESVVTSSSYKEESNISAQSMIVETTEKVESKCAEEAPLTVVYAQASINSCPHNKLRAEHFKSVESIVMRLDHLRKNIKKIELGSYRTYKGKDEEYFDHDVGYKFWVDESNLWQNTRAYIWKHLGQSEWKLPDGSEVSFSRIHVKY